MNHTYRLVWNDQSQRHVPAPESARAQGKSGGKVLKAAALVLAAAFTLPATAQAPPVALSPTALPSGGSVIAGQAVITQSGSQMTIAQGSDKAILHWQGFDIGANAAVRFEQPSAGAIALNRVIAGDASRIHGQLSANGQVWLINPNGVIFGPGSKLDVGGLVASVLDTTNEDFLAGKTVFSRGAATGGIENHGAITAADGGLIALLAPTVSNDGIVSARLGNVVLASGDKITLAAGAGGTLQVAVDPATVRTLIENKQFIVADGGQVIMTGKAADALSASVVSNSGTIQARTIAEKEGRILLLADMAQGEVIHSGLLDASAPNGGDGGFIETSAAKVTLVAGRRVTTKAENGTTGTWLIDPNDYTIAASGGDITGSQLSTDLDSTSVEIQSSSGASAGNGDIHVNDAVSWNQNTLTLTAARDININAVMTASGSSVLVMNTGTANGADAGVAGGTVKVGFAPGEANGFAGRVDFPGRSGTGFLTINGNGYHVLGAGDLGVEGDASTTTLQGMQNNLGGHYALGANIDASATTAWNANGSGGYYGFAPIGSLNNTFLNGTFDGLGHTITGIVINRGDTHYVGLFGYTEHAHLANVGLVGGNITGFRAVGSLVGYSYGSMVSRSYTTSSVTSQWYSGGLIGVNGYNSTLNHSYATGNVTGNERVGGLVGLNDANSAILSSYTTGSVTGSNYVGGLVGNNFNNSTVTHSYSSGNVTGNQRVGGLVGNLEDDSRVNNSYAKGIVIGTLFVGGLIGKNAYGNVEHSYATGNVTGRITGQAGEVGGLIGSNFNGTVSRSYATGNVTGENIVGGLIGLLHTNSTVSESYANGNVTGTFFVGGLIGYAEGAAVMHSYAIGNVTGGGGFAGGLVGLNDQSTLTNSYWDTLTSGQTSSAGGTGMTTAQMKTLANFNSATAANGNTNPGWDISTNGGVATVWRIYEGQTYPLLRGFLSPVTVTANNASKTYDGAAWSGGNGVTQSIPAASLNGILAYGGTSQSATNAGSYSIAPSGLWSTTYDIRYVNGTLTINPVSLTTITGNLTGTVSKTYDGTTAATLNPANFLLTGWVGSDGATVTKTSGTYDDANAGSGKTVTVSLTNSDYSATGSTDLANYTLPTSISGAVGVINPALFQTVTANNAGKTYDGSPWSGGNGVSYSGFVSGQNASVLAGTLAYGGTSQGAVNAGSYSIVPSGLSSSNYSISYVNGNLTIAPAVLTTTITGSLTGTVSKIYDGTTAATLNPANFLLTGWVGSDGASVTKTTGSYDDANAGTGKTVTVSLTNSDYSATGSTDLANYILPTSISGTVGIINPAPLTVTANNAGKTYDANPWSGGNGVSYSGFVSGQNASVLAGALAYGGTSQGAVNAGSYSIVPSGLSSSNYSISYVNGNLTIAPAVLTTTITGSLTGTVSKIYDGTTAATLNPANFLLTGWVGSDGASVTKTTGSYDDANAGTGKTVTVSLTNSDYSATGSTDLANYILPTSISGTVGIINPAPLTVTANNAGKTYDANPWSGGNGVSYSGFVSGQNASVLAGNLAYGGTSQGAANAGSYSIVPSGLSSSNYSISYVNGNLSISPASLVITANDASKPYDGITWNGGNGVNYTGFVAGQDASELSGVLAYGGTSQGAVEAGNYSIQPFGLSSGNYAISYVNGTLNISPAPQPEPQTPPASNDTVAPDGGKIWHAENPQIQAHPIPPLMLTNTTNTGPASGMPFLSLAPGFISFGDEEE